jgi:alkylation response protein AidB-like acyl-CoA dehydrogenase
VDQAEGAAYSFQPFLEALRANWYEDDDLLARLLERYAGDSPPHADLSAWGGLVSGRLRELAEASALQENAPRLVPFDAYGRRVDRIALPASTLEALQEVEGRAGLGSVRGDPFVHYAKLYLCAQNGEAGVVCSVACTDGMVRLLDALGETAAHREAVHRVRASSAERFWHGAQFVTEIQGGSDVPANRTEAVPDGDGYRISGRKWFCSNINADYFLVAARPRGAPPGGEGIGLFLVPAHLEHGSGRNGHTVDRLKEKLGTRALATAEVTFDGARGYAVGPLDRGLSNLLRYVLVTSRFYCVLIAAASLRQARRVADAYARFREVFGTRLRDYPLVRSTLDEIASSHERMLACTFGLLGLWERSRDQSSTAAEALDFRVLLSLCKQVATREATRLLHEAILLLGGNGIEESFTSLPRLQRDAVIMETWEGPHNLLLTQAIRDLRRYDVDPRAFLERRCAGASGLAEPLAEAIRDDDGTVAMAALAPRIVAAFGDRVLEGLDRSGGGEDR